MGRFPKHKLIWSFLPFYFRVCAFSISRTRLSRSLDQATTNLGHGPRGRMMKLFMITLVDTKNSLYQALIQQPAGFFFAAHHLWSARYATLFLHFLVRCLFSFVLQLFFLCKAKIKYMSRRHCTREQLPKTGNLSCCPPEILSIFSVHGALLGRKHGSPENWKQEEKK